MTPTTVGTFIILQPASVQLEHPNRSRQSLRPTQNRAPSLEGARLKTDELELLFFRFVAEDAVDLVQVVLAQFDFGGFDVVF
ncbi:hypothetical protein BH24DEI2_BH24DEI2_24580 [soil metagenome]